MSHSRISYKEPAQVNAPVAWYRLRRVPDDGERGAWGEACTAPLFCLHSTLQVVDTRLPEHYRGDDVPESPIVVAALAAAADVASCRRCSRLRRGHMPGAVNVPWTSVVDPQTHLLVDRRGVLEVFRAAGVDVRRPLTFTGYVGDTACLVALAAVHGGLARDVAVYTGSWTEWSQRADRRLIVRGDEGPAGDGLCPRESSTDEFMSIVADVREATVNC